MVVHTSNNMWMKRIIEEGLLTTNTPELSNTILTWPACVCVWARVCERETNLFVFWLASHQHLEHVAHRVSPHWWDGLPCDLAHVPLQLVHSGSWWDEWHQKHDFRIRTEKGMQGGTNIWAFLYIWAALRIHSTSTGRVWNESTH